MKAGDSVWVKPPLRGRSGGFQATLIEYIPQDQQWKVSSEGETHIVHESLIFSQAPIKPHVNIQGDPIEVSWKFHPDFKEIFLDVWYEWEAPTWKQAFKECSEVGNNMIIWLRDRDLNLFDEVYKQSLEETGEEIMAKRLD